jgi:hypothetical protein
MLHCEESMAACCGHKLTESVEWVDLSVWLLSVQLESREKIVCSMWANRIASTCLFVAHGVCSRNADSKQLHKRVVVIAATAAEWRVLNEFLERLRCAVRISARVFQGPSFLMRIHVWHRARSCS